MINISNHTIFILLDDGRAVPFDSAFLQQRILDACLNAGVSDSWVAQDIALSVEFAISKTLNAGESGSVKAAEIDALVTRILEDAGYIDAAEEYGKVAGHYLPENFRIAELRKFLEERLNLSGEQLASVAARVRNTLVSIAAPVPSPQLILELARHFRQIDTDGVHLDIEIPKHHFAGASLIESAEIQNKLSTETAEMVSKRILTIHPVNLKVFQYLRIGVRLTGLVTESKLSAPVTELSLMPLFYPLAECIDSICLEADSICLERNFADATPLKLLLDFTDTAIFTREWMGCQTPSSAEKTARELALSLASQLTHKPFKITCK